MKAYQHDLQMMGRLLSTLLLYWVLSANIGCSRFEDRTPFLFKPWKMRSLLLSKQQVHHMKSARSMVSAKQEEIKVSSTQSAMISSHNPLIFFPTLNGADPTGASDSTSALQLTINQAFNVSSKHVLMPSVSDLGGVEIHLGGGQYLISKPLTLPSHGGGNVLIHGGTLRASSSFPSKRFLLELGSQAQSHDNDPPMYEDIVLQNLMLDGNYIAGGILLLNPLRTTITNCYITHFGTIGISVHGGHETLIQSSFLGQHITSGSDPHERNFSGTAILLSGNDNVVTDVIIFSAQIGIDIHGEANILTGVHCYNKATGWGGVGIIIRQGASLNRIVGCYLDYTGIVLEATRQITITNSLFIGDAFVLLKASTNNGSSSLYGVSIVDNMFRGGGHGIPIVQVQGKFSHVQQTFVDGNSANGMALRSTRARLSTKGFGSEWTLDLSNILLFPNLIAHIHYSLFASNNSNQNATSKNTTFFPQHSIRSVSAKSITIACDTPIHAIISVSVDQSLYGDDDIGDLYLQNL